MAIRAAYQRSMAAVRDSGNARRPETSLSSPDRARQIFLLTVLGTSVDYP